MTNRKKKLLIVQLSLILIGVLIIFFTYYKNEDVFSEKIISSETQQKIKNKIKIKIKKVIFFITLNTGFDISGNRYILRSEEAETINQINN